MSPSSILKLQAAGKADLFEVEHRLETKIVEIRGEIVNAKAETVRWVVGMGFAQIGLILAVLKLFSH